MKNVNATELARIEAQIKTLESVEIMTGTNDGTFGSDECFRCVGTGDSAFGIRREYETVGGRQRATGPNVDRIPGSMRPLNRQQLAYLRKQVADLRAEAARLRKQK